MKRGLITAIICLSLVVVMSLGVVSAGSFPMEASIQFVAPTPADETYFTEAERVAGIVDIKANVTVTDDGGNLDTIIIYLYDDNGLVDSAMSSTSPFNHQFTGKAYKTYYLNATANDTAGANEIPPTPITRKLIANNPPVVSITITDDDYGVTTSELTDGFGVLGAVTADQFSVEFTPQVTDEDDIADLTYSWNFGDGSALDATKAVVTHPYTTDGIFIVNLTVTDSVGVSTTSSNHEVMVRPSCATLGALGAGEVCVAVPENMGPTDNQGLECDTQAADRYCKCEGYAAGYAGQSITDKMTCDNGGQAGGSRALSCTLSDGGSAITTWILSVVCTGTASVAGACTVDAEGKDPFVKGDATKGDVTWSDICITGTNKLNETTCDGSGNLISIEEDCSMGCTAGACIEPQGGLFCQPDSNKGLSNTIGQGDRDRGDGDVIFYCGLNLQWGEAFELGETCTAGYECISNSCVEEECYGVRTELEEQRNILIKIWCFLTNMGEYLEYSGDIRAANDVIDDIIDVAPEYGACLENPFGAD